MIKTVSTKDMPREVWLEHRRKSIGGSDAAALLGLNPYCSVYSLWAEKTGQVIPEDISDKESVRLGNDLEEYVAKRFAEATGKKVRKDNHIIYNSEYPFAHANVDRVVVGEDAGLECKVTSSWENLQKCRDGDYPDMWYTQMVHYMMVTGKSKWYLGVLCLGHGFFYFEIVRNEAEIAALATAEQQFWQNVETKKAPALDGTEATQDALKVILADSNPYTVDLTGVFSHLAIYNNLKAQMKDLEQQLNEQQAHIMQYMGDAEKGTYDNVTVSYKTQVRKTFDREAYEAANGKIPEQYFKQSTSRPFKVTVRKKK